MNSLSKEQESYIRHELMPYGFMDIDFTDFDYWAGIEPAKAFETFKASLDDFASMLGIARSDVGMNGHITLKLGIDPNVAELTEREIVSGYASMTNNVIAMRAYNSQSFAHEWGHLFDKALGHFVNKLPFDIPVQHSKDGSSLFSEYYLFPQDFLKKTVAFETRNNRDTYEGYIANRTEMFARLMEKVPASLTINQYDLTCLTRDSRDPELLEYENIKPIRPDQHICNGYGIPSPKEEETVSFLSDLNGWIGEMKEAGLLHPSDVSFADLFGREIDVSESPLDAKNDKEECFYMNYDEICVATQQLEKFVEEYSHEEIDKDNLDDVIKNAAQLLQEFGVIESTGLEEPER